MQETEMQERDAFGTLPADFVLLVNAKEDKGYGLILKVAELSPDIHFVAIASQSERDEAMKIPKALGLKNVHIIPRTDRMAELYRRAKVVAVPSYKFVETFSRVCIEAHRFGKPVIGSDVGNVPNLLKRPGIVLQEDEVAWAAELARLYGDAGYYASRSHAALENSDYYSYGNQRRAITTIASTAARPFLLGIGSGIGNMLHVSPLIRRLAEHLGQPIDILVAEDHSDSLFLLHNPKWVNAVYSLRQFALARRYDTIFITHSFGAARLPIRARRVLWSRDWDLFTPDHALHEAQFNLEAAKQLLGIDYGPDDMQRYFISEIEYRPSDDGKDRRLVGFHGGSKDGFWLSKRWPHYTDFAAWLKAQGFRVASFGTPNEYVEGTEDMTGGTIREMAERMLQCSYFVSNDSGVMNIANALGIPLLAIFGPTNPRTRGPLKTTSRSVALTKDCAPCECINSKVFLTGNCQCIAELGLEAVTAEFQTLVRQHGAQPGR